ncbi:hypothetical protein [Ruania albidiflava]|uniref:hypothetical protein n=1 Tax=Ruania albidiflava TaxID=366586 RepID=UPI0012FC6018|nr:hypothetical protein [Ruania albidiflava]
MIVALGEGVDGEEVDGEGMGPVDVGDGVEVAVGWDVVGSSELDDEQPASAITANATAHSGGIERITRRSPLTTFTDCPSPRPQTIELRSTG